jgi:hypothetical protein
VDGGRVGWSAAWGVSAALVGGTGGAFWNTAVSTGPRALIWPACVFSLAAFGGLYMSFAVLGGWWPAPAAVVSCGGVDVNCRGAPGGGPLS